MRKRRARWLPLVLLGVVAIPEGIFGQTYLDLRTQSKSVDFSGANATKPFKSGTLLPSICTVGEMFYKTDAPPGANVYGCTALNSWVIESGVILPAVNGNTGKLLTTDGNGYIWTALAGDVSGTPGNMLVTQLQGRPVSSAPPSSGQVLTWNSGANSWMPQASASGGTTLPGVSGNGGKYLSTDGTNLNWTAPSAGGDLFGTLASASVIQIQGHPVSSVLPASGQFLGWNVNTNRWEPLTPPGGSTLPGTGGNAGRILSTDGANYLWSSLGGDLNGTVTSARVVQLQGFAIAPTAPAGGQTLLWNSSTSRWEPQTPVTGSSLPNQFANGGRVLATDGSNLLWTAAGGDVGGSYGSQIVLQIQGHSVASTLPSAGQVLTWNGSANQWQPQTPSGGGGSNLPSQTGNASRYLTTDGTNLSWGQLGGDLFGSLNNASVIQLQGHPVSSVLPSSGQFLGWNSVTSRWEPLTPPSGGGGISVPGLTGNTGKVLSTDGSNLIWTSPAGDVTGPVGSETVTQIQGRAVSNAIPASGQHMVWNSSTNRWEPQTLPAAGGDLSGSLGSATVTQIQGRPVSSATPASGQVLTWNASANQWQPQNGGSGGSGSGGAAMSSQLGDLLVTQSNPTTLSIGQNCTVSTPCNVRFGNVTYSFGSGATATVSSGTGFAYIYVSSAGTLTVGHNLSLTCNGGCVAQSGISGFPSDSIPVYLWSATNGAWDALGLDQRAMLSAKTIAAGPGIVTTETQGITTIAADTSVVGIRTSVPASSSTACTAGNWAADTSFYYVCVAANQWLRATLAAW